MVNLVINNGWLMVNHGTCDGIYRYIYIYALGNEQFAIENHPLSWLFMGKSFLWQCSIANCEGLPEDTT